mgnify:CR=1 FL=1
MNRCRLETIRAYWSGRVVAYSAVNADVPVAVNTVICYRIVTVSLYTG